MNIPNFLNLFSLERIGADMPTIFPHHKKLKKHLMLALSVLVLASCATRGVDLLRADAYARSEYYLDKANTVRGDKTLYDTYQLLAVRALLKEKKFAQADTILTSLKKLEDDQQIEKYLLLAQSAAYQKKNQAALSNLKAVKPAKLSSSQMIRYYQVRATLAQNRNNLLEALRAYIQVDKMLYDTQSKQENNDTIWGLLRNANPNALSRVAAKQHELELIGWLELANAYNYNISQPQQLRSVLQQWRATHPRHTASLLLPTELQNVMSYQQTYINQIALFLPVSGNARLIGQTIEKGFNDAKNSAANPYVMVKVYDTASASVPDLVERAKQEGMQAVVGPLLKDNVDSLINSSNINGLNILTLNSTLNSRPLPQVCYYDLSLEAEAQSGAQKMWNDGIRTPLLLAPQNELGQRVATAFNQEWIKLSGVDANTYYYNSNEDIVASTQALLAQSSNSAAVGLYIVADNTQLQQVKTTLDNDTVSLPVYANSRSNSANNGAEYRFSMNGVKFTDIPLLSAPDSDQYKQATIASNGDYSLMRLYAMGYDAWSLINKISEIRQVPGFKINGLTGTLSGGINCSIERKTTWLEYQNGNIKVAY